MRACRQQLAATQKSISIMILSLAINQMTLWVLKLPCHIRTTINSIIIQYLINVHIENNNKRNKRTYQKYSNFELIKSSQFVYFLNQDSRFLIVWICMDIRYCIWSSLEPIKDPPWWSTAFT